jgi:hypothetical protein
MSSHLEHSTIFIATVSMILLFVSAISLKGVWTLSLINL